jgi:hypothetical protein
VYVETLHTNAIDGVFVETIEARLSSVDIADSILYVVVSVPFVRSILYDESLDRDSLSGQILYTQADKQNNNQHSCANTGARRQTSSVRCFPPDGCCRVHTSVGIHATVESVSNAASATVTIIPRQLRMLDSFLPHLF